MFKYQLNAKRNKIFISVLFITLLVVHIIVKSRNEKVTLHYFKLVSDSDAIATSNFICSDSLDGILYHNAIKNKVSFKFGINTVKLCSQNMHNRRGMELSELISYKGKTLTVDDKTGIVYEINGDQVTEWVRLLDGDGQTESPFKGEWATVKDGSIYIGAVGKPYTNPDGNILHYNPLWIKIINEHKYILHVNWEKQYRALEISLNIKEPGFIVHEAVVWSQIHQKWFFFPRHVSMEMYSKKSEANSGANFMLITDENFDRIQVVTVGIRNKSRGFSSVRFIPDTQDTVLMGLKTYEYEDNRETYVLVFNIDGTVLYSERKFSDLKYEGFDFI